MNVLTIADGAGPSLVALKNNGVNLNKVFVSEVNSFRESIVRKAFPGATFIGDINNLTQDQIAALPKIDLVVGTIETKSFADGLTKKTQTTFATLAVINEIRKVNNPDVKFLLEAQSKANFEVLGKMATLIKGHSFNFNASLVSPQQRPGAYLTNFKCDHPQRSRVKLKDILVNFPDPKHFLDQKAVDWVLQKDLKVKLKPSEVFNRKMAKPLTSCGVMIKRGVVDNYIEHAEAPEGKTNIRRLTMAERERLQGFSDAYTLIGEDINGERVIISQTQRAKAIGSSTSVKVFEALLKGVNKS